MPAGFGRAKIRCGECGYYAPVPEKLRSADPDEESPAPRPKATPPPQPAKREELRPGVAKPVAAKPKQETVPVPVDDEIGPNLLGGTQEDDDGPYTVPGDGTKNCPECRGKIPFSATFCTRCGTDLATGEKPKKKYQAYERTWESRVSLTLRLQVMGGLLGINVLIALAIAATGSFLGAVALLLVQTGLQSFLLGTYETITLKRTAKGKLTVTKFWRVCFLKQPAADLVWQEHAGVGVIATHQINVFDWIVVFYLFFCLAVFPAIIFYVFFLRPDRMQVAFCDEYGSSNLIAFRTTNREEATEIARLIADAGNLQFRAVM